MTSPAAKTGRNPNPESAERFNLSSILRRRTQLGNTVERIYKEHPMKITDSNGVTINVGPSGTTDEWRWVNDPLAFLSEDVEV